MLRKLNVQFRVGSVDRSQCFSILIIQNLISSWHQTAQFHLSPPSLSFVWGIEGVVNAAIFLNRVSLWRVVAVGVEIEKVAMGKHLGVVEINPLLPVRLFFGCEFNSLEFRSVTRPRKFCSYHCAHADLGSEVAAFVDFILR